MWLDIFNNKSYAVYNYVLWEEVFQSQQNWNDIFEPHKTWLDINKANLVYQYWNTVLQGTRLNSTSVEKMRAGMSYWIMNQEQWYKSMKRIQAIEFDDFFTDKLTSHFEGSGESTGNSNSDSFVYNQELDTQKEANQYLDNGDKTNSSGKSNSQNDGTTTRVKYNLNELKAFMEMNKDVDSLFYNALFNYIVAPVQDYQFIENFDGTIKEHEPVDKNEVLDYKIEAVV